MSTRRQQLLDGLVAHLLRRGLADLSLRPMAGALGTSARMLLFHFGSKERLLGAVLAEMHARLQRSAVAMAAERGRGPALRRFWDWALRPEPFAYLRLLYQLQLLTALRPSLYRRLQRRTSRDWLLVIQAALPPGPGRAELATLLTAVFDGLFLEVVSTGDRRRATRALDLFLRLARARARPARRR